MVNSYCVDVYSCVYNIDFWYFKGFFNFLNKWFMCSTSSFSYNYHNILYIPSSITYILKK